jgi:hypothetical protein
MVARVPDSCLVIPPACRGHPAGATHVDKFHLDLEASSPSLIRRPQLALESICGLVPEDELGLHGYAALQSRRR